MLEIATSRATVRRVRVVNDSEESLKKLLRGFNLLDGFFVAFF